MGPYEKPLGYLGFYTSADLRPIFAAASHASLHSYSNLEAIDLLAAQRAETSHIPPNTRQGVFCQEEKLLFGRFYLLVSPLLSVS